MNKYLKKISSVQWRNKFLKRAYAIDGIASVIDLANSKALPTAVPYRIILADIQSFLRYYPRNELASARAHYNTLHLVAFWRWYCTLVHGWKQQQADAVSSPVFSIILSSNKYEFRQLGPEDIVSRMDTFITQKDIMYMYSCFPGASRSPELMYLFKIILALRQSVRQCFEESYKIFINEIKEKADDIWDYYRLHRVLNNFLYIRKNGSIAGAAFL